MNAVAILTDESSPVCGAGPYALTEYMPVSKSMLERICTPSERHAMIARAAYYRSQQRGFARGYELDDWLAAEHDVNAICGLIEPHPSWDKAC